MAQTGSTQVCWGASQLNRVVHQPLIAAKHVCAFLTANYAQHNTLVVSPGDRIDILMGCLLAEQSEHYPPIAGMVLTTGVKPPATISRILDGLAIQFYLHLRLLVLHPCTKTLQQPFYTMIMPLTITQSIDLAQLQRPHTPRMMFEYFLEKIEAAEICGSSMFL